ncbi:hypothetical protein CYLTODRAFT_487668 [Cylindrobasidium torrendii FP15055 ss-10]|uniref:FHF complex subunit HOOK-interacting protein C-terminal domain-containing protein n=1 Tax=Cylindrobasidium torrendii FP15055 ss-10 TaxID=1314674 RepID=A0A0D7BMS9_9AGAR|nr:hypothetical protein CYLTODRAFT_487668 [Cylindrobasidium torrendii FP15055 ss-10]
MDYFSKFLRPASGARAAPKRAPDLAQELHRAWTVVKDTLEQPDEAQLRRGIQSTVVPAQLRAMVDTLVSESTRIEEGMTGACMEYLLKNDVLGTLVRLSEADLPAGIQAEVLRTIQNMVVLLDEQFLVHSVVHRAVLRLLRNCAGDDLQDQMAYIGSGGGRARVGAAMGAVSEPSEYEEDLVNLLCILCSRIRTYRELLMIFFHDKHWGGSGRLFAVEEEDEGDEDADEEKEYMEKLGHKRDESSSIASSGKPEYEFLLFNYLLRFVHREGQIGDFARAGLLFLIDVAMSATKEREADTQNEGKDHRADPVSEAATALAEYILDGDFSQVLGAGLGAVYSLLPGKLYFPRVMMSEREEEEDEPLVEGDYAPGEGPEWGYGAPGDKRAEDVEDATSPDVRARLDHFLKMLEFLEDVVRRNAVGDSGTGERATATQQGGGAQERTQGEGVQGQLVRAILGAVRTSFLENVLYPTILECSDADGSAVAVMAYLDGMVRTVGHGQLGRVLLDFLMSEQDEDDGEREKERQLKEQKERAEREKMSKRERRKSSAMTLLEMEAPATGRQTDYFTSLGRFTLQDLVLTNLKSGKQDAVGQALQLMHTLLEVHPAMCVDKMLSVERIPASVELDLGIPVLGLVGGVSSDSDEEDDDDYLFGGESRPKKHVPRMGLPQTTYATHEREMGLYLALVSRVDPAHGPGDAFSTGYEHYLRDALTRMSEAMAAGDEEEEATPPHKLNTADPVLKTLLAALGRFFANEPRTNVALTGVLAALAAHPRRSLAGWLTFDSDSASSSEPPLPSVASLPSAGLFGQPQYSSAGGEGYDTDTSADFPTADALARETVYLPAASIGDKATRPAVHTLLHALVSQLERYRELVPGFDGYLRERRQGLLFAENLSDAIGGEGLPSTGGGFDGIGILRDLKDVVAETFTPSSSSPSPSKNSGGGLVGLFTPKRRKTKGSADLGRSVSGSLGSGGGRASPSSTRGIKASSRPGSISSSTAGEVYASPFVPHYRKTKGVRVEPLVVEQEKAPVFSTGAELGGFEDPEDAFGEKAAKEHRHVKSGSVGSWGDGVSWDSASGKKKGEGEGEMDVSLSHVLDNVVILEEGIKELVAIIHARRSLGVDAVRYL